MSQNKWARSWQICSWWQKLKQDIARQKSSLEATRDMVTRFMETADSTTAAVLQGKLAEVSQRFEQLCLQQQEKESSLKKLLPQAEMFEHLSEKLQQFMENKSRLLASGNQPDQDIAHFFQQIQVRLYLPDWWNKGEGRARNNKCLLSMST